MTPHENGAVRIGSLCSGYGGLDLGLMAVVGGSVAWHVEYDKHPSAVLEARFPGVPNYGDLTTTDWTQVEPVDWLTAAYPCQPFSHAGKRKGSADERHLWPSVADAISVLRPRRVLLENVAGHVSLGLDAVLWDLAALGYDATWGVVRAADAGAPHNRARIFIVAADTTGGAGSVGYGDDVCAGRGADGRGTQAGRGATADASGERHGSGQDGRSVGRVDGENARSPRQRERPRAVTGDRSATAPTDAGSEAGGLGTRLCQSAQGRVRRGRPDHDGSQAVSDTTGDGWDEGRPEPERLVGRSDAAECGDAASNASSTRLGGRPGEPSAEEARAISSHEPADHRRLRPAAQWGPYQPAIVRWESVTGRSAPRPTDVRVRPRNTKLPVGMRGSLVGYDPRLGGYPSHRLSPRFVEWMMGLPAGWVTDVAIPRNAQLKALGNGVVPQQAALALRLLLARAEVVAA